jgi:hypothetical protein
MRPITIVAIKRTKCTYALSSRAHCCYDPVAFGYRESSEEINWPVLIAMQISEKLTIFAELSPQEERLLCLKSFL